MVHASHFDMYLCSCAVVIAGGCIILDHFHRLWIVVSPKVFPASVCNPAGDNSICVAATITMKTATAAGAGKHCVVCTVQCVCTVYICTDRRVEHFVRFQSLLCVSDSYELYDWRRAKFRITVFELYLYIAFCAASSEQQAEIVSQKFRASFSVGWISSHVYCTMAHCVGHCDDRIVGPSSVFSMQ